MSAYILQFGSISIPYSLTFHERKSLRIAVSPELQVTVKAPIDSDQEQIQKKLRKRAPWIINQLDFFLSFHPRTSARRYISGESHLYMGRNYLLRVVDSNQERVILKGGIIEAHTYENSKAEDVLKKWYRERAEVQFKRIAQPWMTKFERYNVSPKNLRILEMNLRWGSCTPKGNIILNPELIKAPKHCIEYVIVHELCHLVHHNHSSKFFELQSQVMPDWEKWKNKLERLLA